jgi:DNA mismatch repair protein MutS2
MSPMLQSGIGPLEFEDVLRLLEGYAASPLGKARIRALRPSAQRDEVERQQRLAAEVCAYWRIGGRFDLSGLTDTSSLLDLAAVSGAALEIAQLRDLLGVAERAAAWREIALHPPARLPGGWPEVESLSRGIPDLAPLLRQFEGKMAPDGTLEDRASLALGRIRREVERQKRSILESLRAQLRRLSEDGAVQEELITIRGERFVIPVRVEQKRKVQGVVHGASSSGQTLFVEPLESIEENNELVRLLEEEQAEIHRILAELTRHVADAAPRLRAAQQALAELELQFAKARFAEDYDAVTPVFTGRRLVLEQARHPLLERNLRRSGGSMVPISVALEEGHRQLIISGPNTGGKTVALKTLGLLALMAQAGLALPAARAELPVFDAVLADIGDAQSIEQNLSTFSAHIANLDRISHTATADSLVLLDELGSSTDPEEGAALAVAIAAHFGGIGCLTIISTHHTALKVYAAHATGVLNASVGFDEVTLHPTYRLRVGVPGVSAGIDIAQQLGLNPAIIAAARERVGAQARDVARFLARLHEEVAAVEQERAALRRREAEVEQERRRLERDGQAEQSRKLKEWEEKLASLLKECEFQAREAVAAVQDRVAAQKLSRESERRLARLRREFKEQVDATVVAHRSGADIGDPHARPHEVALVGEGDTVRLKSLGRNVRVERRLEEDLFEVSAGALKMKVPRSDIAEVVASARGDGDASRARPLEAARRRGIRVTLAAGDAPVPSELNVIGQTVEEATTAVERFVDHAWLAGHTRVRIVHGAGMGVLRKALRQQLKAHPHVASVAEPQPSEGGAGATVVELRP